MFKIKKGTPIFNQVEKITCVVEMNPHEMQKYEQRKIKLSRCVCKKQNFY